MVEFESLILEASVVDDFSRTLNELKTELGEIKGVEEAVEDIDFDVRIAEAIADIQILKQQLRSIDDDINIDVDTDTDPLQRRVEDMSRRAGRFVDRDEAGHARPTLLPRDFDIDVDQRSRLARLAGGRRDLDINLDGSALLPDFGEAAAAGGVLGFGLDPEPGRFSKAKRNIGGVVRDFARLRVSMGMFMNLMASVIPIFFVFVGALPAVIGGLTALAVAAGAAAVALGGVGALAAGSMLFEGGELNVEEAYENMREVLDEFLEAWQPLMEALHPVAEAFFRILKRGIRDLAAHMNVLLGLSDDMIAAFDWIADVAGPAMQDLVLFAEAAMPAVSRVIQGLGSFDWFRIFAQLMAATLPKLEVMAAHLVAMLGPLFQMSMGFLTATNVVLGLLAVFFKILGVVPGLAEAFGMLIAVTLTLLSVTFLYSRLTGTLVEKLGTMLVEAVNSAMLGLYEYIAAQYGATAATLATLAAVSALIGVITFGLAPALSGILGAFSGVNGEMNKAVDNLEDFGRTGGISSNAVGGPGGSAVGYGPTGSGTTVVAPDRETGMAVANTLDWKERTSSTTNESNVEDKKHSR